MKRVKTLNRVQKECASAHYLRADDWYLLEEWEFYYKLIHRVTNRIKFIDKFTRRSVKR